MDGPGFGRPIVASESRDLALVSDTPQPEQGLRADFGRMELKEKIRSELM